MTTISTPSNRHVPIIPLSMPLYTYKYPNNDSIPYSELPDQFGIYNKEFPATYKWETRYLEKNLSSSYLGPDWFKEPPKQFSFSPNIPKENYSPIYVDQSNTLASNGYVPQFNNKTHQSWKAFLNQTPEIIDLETRDNLRNNQKLPFIGSAKRNNLDRADFFQRPQMALSSRFRNNDGFRHSSFNNNNNWKPYGNPQCYFNNYVTGSPKF